MIAVAVALYLFDCFVLLERGQALWSRGGLSFGSNHYQIRGKVVALLNPLTPFLPAFRTAPLFSGARGLNASIAIRAVKPLAAFALAQFVLVFVALPCYLYLAPGWPFFVSLMLAYANAIAMLGAIWWRFRGAGIATRPLFGLGFSWLACLPLSVNCLRKAALACDLAMDSRRAMRLLPEKEKQGARSDLAAQIGEAMLELDEGDPLHARLAALRYRLAPGAAHERL